MKLIKRSHLATEIETKLVALAGEAAHKAAVEGHSAAIAFAEDGWAIVVAIDPDYYRSRVVKVADPAEGIVFIALDAALALLDEPETHEAVLGYVGRTNVVVFTRKELTSQKVRHAIEDVTKTGTSEARRIKSHLLKQWLLFRTPCPLRTDVERQWSNRFGAHMFDAPEFRRMALQLHRG